MKKLITLITFLIASFISLPQVNAADNLIIPKNEGKAYLLDTSNNLWPASVIYTTDGSGHAIPITGGSSTPTVIQGAGAATHASPWWLTVTDGTNDAGVSTYGLKVDVQNAVPSANTNGAIYNSSAIQSVTATTITPPANAVGFLLEAESSNTANIRWAIGATASATVGNLYEPGRDSGWVQCGATISVIAMSGTQSVSVQWLLSH